MDTIQIDKYTKLNWEFGPKFDWFKSPRMKEIWYLSNKIEKTTEEELIDFEKRAILCDMRINVIKQFHQLTLDIMKAEKIRLDNGEDPSKLIEVNYKLKF